MAVINERCPMCGGTVKIPDKANIGQCDSCFTQFSLTDLQRFSDRLKYSAPEEVDEDGYDSALSTDDIAFDSALELYQKAEDALASEQWRLADQFGEEILRRDPKNAKGYLYKLLAELKLYKKEKLASLDTPFDKNKSYILLMRFADRLLQAEMQNYADEANARILENKYASLCSEMERVTQNGSNHSIEKYKELAKQLAALNGYKDSDARRAKCLAVVEEKRKLRNKQEKQDKLRRIALWGLAAAVVIAIIVGIVALIVHGVNKSKAQYDLDKFEIKITDKTNLDYDSNSVRYRFGFVLVNNSKHDASVLYGYLTVKDADGNILLSGSTDFRGEILAKSDNICDLNWELNRCDESAELWNSDFEELEFSFRITGIEFENGKSKSYDSEDIVVKPFNAEYIASENAEYELNKFSVKVTDKTNVEYDSDNVWCKFDFVLVNNSRHNLNALHGYFIIKDADGNVLSKGAVDFTGKIKGKVENQWELTWKMGRTDGSVEVWNSDFEDLEILFRITKADFENGKTRSYDSEDIVVKPAGGV